MFENSSRMVKIKQDTQAKAVWVDRKSSIHNFTPEKIPDDKSTDKTTDKKSTGSINIRQSLKNITKSETFDNDDFIIINGNKKIEKFGSLENINKKPQYKINKAFYIGDNKNEKSKGNDIDPNANVSSVVDKLKGKFDGILEKNIVLNNHTEQYKVPQDNKKDVTNNLASNAIENSYEVQKSLNNQKGSIFKHLNKVIANNKDIKQHIRQKSDQQDFNGHKNLTTDFKFEVNKKPLTCFENSRSKDSITYNNKYSSSKNITKSKDLDSINSNKTQSFLNYFKKVASTRNEY